jgi:hypothetical protein
MSLRIRALRIVANTLAGPFGVELRFSQGLNVIRAGNSAGKSTCLNAIIYALGLEGMWGASRRVPLPHALTQQLEYDGRNVAVVDSSVLLEIENAANEVLTLSRVIKGERAKNLVTVREGKQITEAASLSGPSQDYYVRESGAAVLPSGLHSMLAAFVGWELPTVPRYQGGEGLLYMEAVFPLMNVEQKQGWASIEGKFPTYLGIRDIATRAIDFLLALETGRIQARRQILEARVDSLRSHWRTTVGRAEVIAREVGGQIRDLPRSPISVWPPEVPPSVWLVRGEDWIPLDSIITEWSSRIQSLAHPDLSAHNVHRGSHLEEQLVTAQTELRNFESLGRDLADTLEAEEEQRRAALRRLTAVHYDLERHRDARTLQRLGGVAKLKTSQGECPTCHQPVGEPLILHAIGYPVLSIDDNIGFLEEQRRTFEFANAESEKSGEAKQVRLIALRREMQELRGTIRALQRTLVSDERLPSEELVHERLRLQAGIDRLEAFEKQFSELENELAAQVEAWRGLQEELEGLPPSGLTQVDEAKLLVCDRLIIEQLLQYGFQSQNPAEVRLSRGSLKPEHPEVDLQFDSSASDTIRLAWSFRVALLELARTSSTNHLGMLLLDEPKQQEVEGQAFSALLRRLGTTFDYGQQVIVAASQPIEAVLAALADLPHNLMDFSGRILSRL